MKTNSNHLNEYNDQIYGLVIDEKASSLTQGAAGQQREGWLGFPSRIPW